MRYIRLTFTGFDAAEQIRVAELRFYDDPGEPVPAGPSVASSEDVLFPASNVSDGDTASEWAIAANAWPVAWIYFDLAPALQELNKYEMFLATVGTGPTAWTVEGADDPAGPWTLIENRVQDPPTYGAWVEFIPAVPVSLVPAAGVVGIRGAVATGGERIGLHPSAGVVGVRGASARRGPALALVPAAGVVGVRGASARRGPALALVPAAGVVGVRGATGYPLLALTDPTATTIYRCYLDLDGDAVELPIATIQTRLQEVGTSFLAVTVPGGLGFVEAVNARRDGALSLRRGVRTRAGQELLTEVFRGALSGVTLDAGARSSTLTLTGSQSIVVTAPKQVALAGVQSYADRDGTLQVRAAVDEHLRPGDTAVFVGGVFEVASVLILESVRGLSRMDVGG